MLKVSFICQNLEDEDMRKTASLTLCLQPPANLPHVLKGVKKEAVSEGVGNTWLAALSQSRERYRALWDITRRTD